MGVMEMSNFDLSDYDREDLIFRIEHLEGIIKHSNREIKKYQEYIRKLQDDLYLLKNESEGIKIK